MMLASVHQTTSTTACPLCSNQSSAQAELFQHITCLSDRARTHLLFATGFLLESLIPVIWEKDFRVAQLERSHQFMGRSNCVVTIVPICTLILT